MMLVVMIQTTSKSISTTTSWMVTSRSSTSWVSLIPLLLLSMIFFDKHISKVDGTFVFQSQRQHHRQQRHHIDGSFGINTLFLAAAASNNNDGPIDNNHLSQADKERLLLTEPALNAFIVAEMRDFVTKRMTFFDEKSTYAKNKWTLNDETKIKLGYIDPTNFTVINPEYVGVSIDKDVAIDLICNTTQIAFKECMEEQPGLLSALGSAILYFRNYYRETPTLISACERIGISDYDIAHHITDMFHHVSFRGTYTKTLQPSGVGDIAAKLAVGLSIEDNTDNGSNKQQQKKDNVIIELDDEEIVDEDEFDDDECLVWSPTTPGVCIHWKSDNDDASRKRRFEKIQMEGTRDPRRGGSGTTR